MNTAVGNTGAALLLQNITDMKTTLSDMSIDLPVGTSDAGSYFNNEVLAAVDYGVGFYFHSDAIFKWMIADVCEYFCSYVCRSEFAAADLFLAWMIFISRTTFYVPLFLGFYGN